MLFVLAVLAYVGARETSVFAVRELDVRGGTPQIRAEVRAALAPERGVSLLRVDAATLDRRLGSLPEVRSFTFDRSFPHTLHVVVRREHPVLVVRQVPGKAAYLVAASGRVLRSLPHPQLSHLPRVWVKRDVSVPVGGTVSGPAAAAAAVVAALRGTPLPGGVGTVRASDEELTLQLRSGLQVRLGDRGDLRLKLAIARRILRVTGAAASGSGYLDVSVPERPVLNTNSQVGG